MQFLFKLNVENKLFLMCFVFSDIQYMLIESFVTLQGNSDSRTAEHFCFESTGGCLRNMS